jgi:hypothetical protein
MIMEMFDIFIDHPYLFYFSTKYLIEYKYSESKKTSFNFILLKESQFFKISIMINDTGLTGLQTSSTSKTFHVKDSKEIITFIVCYN